jgi:hypothetical protein
VSKAIPGMIEQFGAQVEAVTGPGVRAQVMAGSETITANTGGAEVAHWAKGAIERLDALISEKTRVEIMENCGDNCARRNSRTIDRARARRAKFATEEAFLAAEIRKPPAGTRLERDWDILIQAYTPRAFTHPMRCYCALVKDLPEGETMSQTYCHCSKAFVQTMWQTILGRPVAVQILESAVSGASECRFRIMPCLRPPDSSTGR